MTAFSFEISASFVAVGFGKLDKLRFFRKLWASSFFSWQFLKSYQRSKVFLFLQTAFCGQCDGLLFSVAAHFSYLSLMCLLFLQAVFGGQGGCIMLQKFFRVGHS